MKFSVSSVIGWICVGLVSAFNAFAAVMKLMPVEPGSQAEQMAERLGMAGLETGLALLQIPVIILYVIPRTSTVGTVLMAGYMGGVLATLLTHGFSHADSAMIYVALALIAVGAYFRNPELLWRLKGKAVSA